MFMARSVSIYLAIAVGFTAICCLFSAGSIAVCSFATDRQNVERPASQGMECQGPGITFEYDGGRRETRRGGVVGIRRVRCDGEDCMDALKRGLNGQDTGSDDY